MSYGDDDDDDNWIYGSIIFIYIASATSQREYTVHYIVTRIDELLFISIQNQELQAKE